MDLFPRDSVLGMGKGKGVRGKGERLNLFLFPLTFNLFPCLKSLHTFIYSKNGKSVAKFVRNAFSKRVVMNMRSIAVQAFKTSIDGKSRIQKDFQAYYLLPVAYFVPYNTRTK